MYFLQKEKTLSHNLTIKITQKTLIIETSDKTILVSALAATRKSGLTPKTTKVRVVHYAIIQSPRS